MQYQTFKGHVPREESYSSPNNDMKWSIRGSLKNQIFSQVKAKK